MLRGALGAGLGAVWPRTAGRTRARALALSAVAGVRLVISLDSGGCVFSLCPRLRTAFLAPSPLPPALLLCLASASLSAPVLRGDPGSRGGRLRARSPRWLPSTGLAPPGSLPSRDSGGKMQANSSGFVFLAPPLPSMNPVEVSFLLFPFRAAIFLTSSECFGVPLPCVLGEVELAWGRGC